MYERPVVIFGAGATKACGGPLTWEILPRAFEQQAFLEREDFFPTLNGFLVENFHVPRDVGSRAADSYPPLPLLISLIDVAIDRKQSFGVDWPHDRLVEVRSSLEYAIFALLDHELKRLTDGNHYEGLIEGIQTPDGATPTLISLNYDVIADNTLMRVNEHRGRMGFPDYGCDVATEVYDTAEKHGTLYKLHGSLSWLHCPGCNRLDIGVSPSGKRMAKMLEVLFHETSGQEGDLAQRYSCHGSKCVDCGTFVRPVMITPTHMKDYRNPHISQVWYRAERALQKADRAWLVGYSLPEDDVDVIYLLKRGLSHLDPQAITVVEYDEDLRGPREHPVGRRYTTLFGDNFDWHPEGLAEYVASGSF